MNNELPKPRLDYIDHPRFAELAQYLSEGIEARRWSEPKFPQLNQRKIGGDSYVLACLLYALGHPLDEVSTALRDCAIAYRQVFVLRGTEPAFPVKKAHLRTHRRTGDMGDLSKLSDANPVGSIDYSLSNSKEGLRAVYCAWAVLDTETGLSLASMLHDPAEATYIGPQSFVCTNDEQLLAYSVRDLLTGKATEMRHSLDILLNDRSVPLDIVLQAKVLHSLIEQHGKVKDRIADYVDWFGAEAQARSNRDDPDFFLCTPAIGLTNLALEQRRLSRNEVNYASAYFPTALAATDTRL